MYSAPTAMNSCVVYLPVLSERVEVIRCWRPLFFCITLAYKKTQQDLYKKLVNSIIVLVLLTWYYLWYVCSTPKIEGSLSTLYMIPVCCILMFWVSELKTYLRENGRFTYYFVWGSEAKSYLHCWWLVLSCNPLGQINYLKPVHFRLHLVSNNNAMRVAFRVVHNVCLLLCMMMLLWLVLYLESNSYAKCVCSAQCGSLYYDSRSLQQWRCFWRALLSTLYDVSVPKAISRTLYLLERAFGTPPAV